MNAKIESKKYVVIETNNATFRIYPGGDGVTLIITRESNGHMKSPDGVTVLPSSNKKILLR